MTPRRRPRHIRAPHVIAIVAVLAAASAAAYFGLGGVAAHTAAGAAPGNATGLVTAGMLGVPVAPSLHLPAKRHPRAKHTTVYRGSRDIGVPILTYHVIRQAPWRRSDQNQRLDVITPATFAAQLHTLAAAGYHAVTLRQVYAFWFAKGALPRRPFVITFDDGSSTMYRAAAPIMRRYHWPGVCNLISASLGRRGKVTPAQVRRLIGLGWEVDSHTVDHRDLVGLSPAQVRGELVGSRRRLHRLFDVPVDFIAFPHGDYVATTLAAARRAGYLGALTTHFGLAYPGQIFELYRVNLNDPRALTLLGPVMRRAALAGQRAVGGGRRAI